MRRHPPIDLVRFLFAAAFLVSLCYAESADSWAAVRAVPPGKTLRVESATRKIEGTLQSASDADLSLTTATGPLTMTRAEVTRVYMKGNSHRLRNTLIGAGIGVAIGLVINGTLGAYLRNESSDDPAAAMIAVPIAVCAGLGAAMPSSGMRKIYDVGKTRRKP